MGSDPSNVFISFNFQCSKYAIAITCEILIHSSVIPYMCSQTFRSWKINLPAQRETRSTHEMEFKYAIFHFTVRARVIEFRNAIYCFLFLLRFRSCLQGITIWITETQSFSKVFTSFVDESSSFKKKKSLRIIPLKSFKQTSTAQENVAPQLFKNLYKCDRINHRGRLDSAFASFFPNAE